MAMYRAVKPCVGNRPRKWGRRVPGWRSRLRRPAGAKKLANADRATGTRLVKPSLPPSRGRTKRQCIGHSSHVPVAAAQLGREAMARRAVRPCAGNRSRGRERRIGRYPEYVSRYRAPCADAIAGTGRALSNAILLSLSSLVSAAMLVIASRATRPPASPLRAF